MSNNTEVVVVGAVRSAVGLYGKSLKEWLGVDMATENIKELLKRTGMEDRKHEIGDVVLAQLYFRNKEEPNVGRTAAYYAGLHDAPGMTIQRACAAGLQAIISGAQEIVCEQSEVVIAGGTESMSNAPYELYSLRWGKKMLHEEIFDSMYGALLSCPPTHIGMGMTAENLAAKFNMTREELDQFAYESQARAKAAQEAGKFEEEIFPLTIAGPKNEKIPFLKDESPRPNTTLEGLAKLKPVFKPDGLVTAGNACTLNDGVAMTMLTSRKKADGLGLKPIARLVSYAVVAVDPNLMGYGPIPAARKALEKANLKISDIDLFEINEAFASVPVAFMKELGVPRDQMNINGGAIALGHPIGATGVRLVTSLVHEMKRSGARRGLVGICQGTGMGTAAIFERCD